MTTESCISPPVVLPQIIRRVHPRATRLKLRIVQGQVFLTVPPCAKAADIERFLRSSQAWLQQHWVQFAAQPKPTVSCPDDFLVQSNSLSISILNKKWSVKINGPQNSKKINQNQEIILPKQQPAKHLTAWVLAESKRALPKYLDQLAKQHNFSYQRCSVRHAKTRWGSCNQQGSISLNAGLALLDQAMIDYVLLHELCHTRHMNHSERFWAEVARVCPDYQAQRNRLKQFRWPEWWQP
ncbi:MAG: SprT family zinc-dependent metalloprotease [Moraxellaceae bacterium]